MTPIILLERWPKNNWGYENMSYKKMFLAKYGHKDHLDKLVDDLNADVKIAVAERGHKDHLDKLVDDPDWVVSGLAKKRLGV